MNQSALFLLAAAVAVPSLLFSRQEPEPAAPLRPELTNDFTVQDEQTRVIVLPPTREVYWDTIDVGDDRPYNVLTVPKGRRFILTDVWTMRSSDYPDQAPQPLDRLWIETDGNGKRRVVIDANMEELPHIPVTQDGTTVSIRPQPLHWESGVTVEPENSLWFNYDFAGDNKRNWIRRFHISGYFEDATR